MRTIAFIATLMLACIAQAALPRDCDLALTLKGALCRVAFGAERRCDVELDLRVRDGRLLPEAWAYAHDYNRADHSGTAAMAGDTITVALDVQGDGWVGGGAAKYTIALQQEGLRWSGQYTGIHRGQALAGPLAVAVRDPWPSSVAGRAPVLPGEHPRLIFRKADIPTLRERAKTPEGQRILAWLKEELALDALQPGRASFGYGYCRRPRTQAMEACEGFWAAGHALLYVLDDDKAEAQRAKDLVRLAMLGNAAQDEIWVFSQRINGVAMAYDLCYDVWDEPFRLEVASWLERFAYQLTQDIRDYRPEDHSVAVPDLNRYGSDLALYRASAGTAALAILGDPGTYHGEAPMAREPFQRKYKPFDGVILKDPSPYPRPSVPHIAAPKGFTPGAGVPTVRFAHDGVITDWLCTPLLPSDAVDPLTVDPNAAGGDKYAPVRQGWDTLEALGGSAAARPEAGTAITVKGITGGFQPMDRGWVFHDGYTAGRDAISLDPLVRTWTWKTPWKNTAPIKDAQGKVTGYTSNKAWPVGYFYTVLENDAPRYVRLRLGSRFQWWPNVWIAGEPVQEDEVFHLDAGRYPVMIQLQLPFWEFYSSWPGRRGSWHYGTTILDDETIPSYPTANCWFMPRFVTADDPKVRWQAGFDAFVAGGRRTATAARSLAIAERAVRRWADAALGEGCWGPENDGDGDAIEMVHYFLVAERMALGRDLLPGTPFDRFLPLMMTRGDYDEYGRSISIAAGARVGGREHALAAA